MSPDHLPDFKGHLAPAPWSGIKLTMELEISLALSAQKSCSGCGGKGWTGSRSLAHPCHCIRGRQAPRI